MLNCQAVLWVDPLIGDYLSLAVKHGLGDLEKCFKDSEWILKRHSLPLTKLWLFSCSDRLGMCAIYPPGWALTMCAFPSGFWLWPWRVLCLVSHALALHHIFCAPAFTLCAFCSIYTAVLIVAIFTVYITGVFGLALSISSTSYKVPNCTSFLPRTTRFILTTCRKAGYVVDKCPIAWDLGMPYVPLRRVPLSVPPWAWLALPSLSSEDTKQRLWKN